jgi:hypothetical protein
MKSLRFNLASCLYRGLWVVLGLGGWENCARQLMAAHPLPPEMLMAYEKRTLGPIPWRGHPAFSPRVFAEDIEIKEERPTVTLTFAQSLDAKIAGDRWESN